MSDKLIEVSSVLEAVPYLAEYRGIVFDLDDTLYPEKDYVRSGYKQVAVFLCTRTLPNGEQIAQELWQYHTEKKQAIDELLYQRGIFTEELREACLRVYRSHTPEIALYPGVAEMLVSLKAEGRKLGIITDGRPEGQQAKIATLRLRDFFETIIITDELGGAEYRKPHPKAYTMLQEKWQLPFSQMVYLGDNADKDFIAPSSLGMGAIYVNNPEGLYYVAKR
jgi:putative hydrolase of the HAD superfamily